MALILEVSSQPYYLYLVAEAYRNRYNRDMLEYLRVLQKEEKRVNRVHQWFIVLCHDDFKGA